jgi:hypothetical protein
MRKHFQIIKEQHNGFTHTFLWIDHLDLASLPHRILHPEEIRVEAYPQLS